MSAIAGRCVVVGGGVSGLACGIALARQGRSVTLVERRPYLGGRATTQPTIPLLDNSPHLVAGAYTMLRSLLKAAGSPLEFPKSMEVKWFDPQGKQSTLVLGKPLETLISTFQSFRWHSIRFGKALTACRSTGNQFRTVKEWTTYYRLAGNVTNLVRLLTISTMNTPPEEASFRLFAEIIRLTLFRAGIVRS